MRRFLFSLIAMLTLLPMPGASAVAQTPAPSGTGTLRISMVSCPPDIDPWFEPDACTEKLEDDGSATVTYPDGSSAALNSFERDENGAYVIITGPGMVTVSGLASENREFMATDANVSSDDSGEWFVPTDADINGQVTYYDHEEMRPLPVAHPGRENGTINLYLMLCDNGIPQDGTTGCEAIEDDGRIYIPSNDTVNKLTAYERNDQGGYILTGGDEHPQLELDIAAIESDNGYDTTYSADEITMNQTAIWNVVEGHERDVYIYYTPAHGDPQADTGALAHDSSLPPAEPDSQGPSMGGPEGLGEVRIHVLNCDEGVTPSLETCTESVSSVDEIMVDMRRREPMPLSSFERADDGAWLISGPSGEAVLTGMEPIRTDAGITNGIPLDGGTIQFTIDSGDSYDLYVIYYFTE